MTARRVLHGFPPFLLMFLRLSHCTLSISSSKGKFGSYIWSCPILLFVTVIKIMTNSNLYRKLSIWLTCSDHSPTLREAKSGTQGRNLEAKTKTETME